MLAKATLQREAAKRNSARDLRRSIMSYLPRHQDFGPPLQSAAAAELDAAEKPSILRRVFDAFVGSRQRDVDRQIERFLAARSGGYLTDNLEREISQHLMTSNWSASSGPFRERRFP
jgi:hypothetical protein